MTSRGYLGLDIGGTGAKAGVFDERGNARGFGHRPYRPAIPGPGQAEIPIDEIYAAARDAARDAVRQGGLQIAAMGVCTQGQTFVTLDSEDRPLHPAILWYDSRAREEASAMHRQVVRALGSRPAPLIEAIASAPKILWLRRHRCEAMSRARRYLLLPDYFSYRLTGVAVTDPSTAHSSGLYVEAPAVYSAEALEYASIREDQLAQVYQPATPVGRIRPDMCREWGLGPDAVLVTGTNDQYAGAIGACNIHPGIVSETSGTCLALVTLVTDVPPLPAGLFSGRFPVKPYAFLLAYSKTAGVVLDWYRDEFCPAQSLHDLDAAAAEVEMGARGINALPHFDGAVSPRPNPAARGAFCNLNLGHGRSDFYRALLESLSFSLRENLELIAANGPAVECLRSIGGGARSDVWMQLKADVSGIPVERPAASEAAVLGAAILAACGVGAFPGIEECARAFFRVARVFEPRPEQHALSHEPYRRYIGLYRALYGS